MPRKKRRSRFDREAVQRHAAHHHPNCPAEMVALFADDISMREWEGSCGTFRLRIWPGFLRPAFGGRGVLEVCTFAEVAAFAAFVFGLSVGGEASMSFRRFVQF